MCFSGIFGTNAMLHVFVSSHRAQVFTYEVPAQLDQSTARLIQLHDSLRNLILICMISEIQSRTVAASRVPSAVAVGHVIVPPVRLRSQTWLLHIEWLTFHHTDLLTFSTYTHQVEQNYVLKILKFPLHMSCFEITCPRKGAHHLPYSTSSPIPTGD